MTASFRSILSNSYIQFVALTLFSFSVIYVSERAGFVPLILFIGLFVGMGLVYLSYSRPQYNYPILLTSAFLIPFAIRAFKLYGLSVGILNEVLIGVMLVTLIFNGRIGGFKSFIGLLFIGLFLFMALEVVNPNAASRTASFLGLRAFLPKLLIFFILYSSISSKKTATTFLIAWFALGLLAALYGLNQEFFGLPSFDYAYATGDEKIYKLLFTWGRIRKFSFFFSPTEFGILMAITGVAASIAFFYTTQKSLKVLFALTGLLCFWSMMYTGSRTAMVLIPIGFVFMIAVTFNRYVIAFSLLMGGIGAGLLMKPGGNSAVFVMSTAFSGKDDPSMNVRLVNQQLIRSYIHERPMGFGLGSTGYLGRKYSPNTLAGSFPPDSEYVRIAIETGWIGLFVWCIFLALCFAYTVNVYFKLHDEYWKGLIVISLVSQVLFMVAFYPQEVLGSFALSLIFSGILAMTARINAIANARKKGNEGNETDTLDEFA